MVTNEETSHGLGNKPRRLFRIGFDRTDCGTAKR